MPGQTVNYQLPLPLEDEYYSVAVVNEVTERLDALLKDREEEDAAIRSELAAAQEQLGETIEGGLTPELAYTVGDSYIRQIEDSRHLSEIPHITHTMYEEFIRRVHNQKHSPVKSRKIRDIMDYIENHAGEKLTVAELAAHAGYSESSLSHKFKQETGMSINAYIKTVRIEKARLLLETTKDSVQDIAVRVGFYGRSHLARAFQELVGMGPLEYRAKNGAGKNE